MIFRRGHGTEAGYFGNFSRELIEVSIISPLVCKFGRIDLGLTVRIDGSFKCVRESCDHVDIKHLLVGNFSVGLRQ